MRMKKLSIMGVMAMLITALAFGTTNGLLAAGNKVWTGAAGDNNLSTAANWQDGIAPVAGDVLDFSSITGDASLISDVDLAYGGVIADNPDCVGTISIAGTLKLGENSTYVNRGCSISPDNLTSQGIVTFEGGPTYIGGVGKTVSLVGMTAKTAVVVFNSDQNSISLGVVTAADGSVVTVSGSSVQYSAQSFVVENGGAVNLPVANGATVSFPITLGGGTGTAKPNLTVAAGFGKGGGNETAYVATLAGTIVLRNDAEVGVGSNSTVKVTGPLSGPYVLGLAPIAVGKLEILSSNNTSKTPGGIVEKEYETIKYEADAPNIGITVFDKQIAVVTGSYGITTVGYGGVLKGTGSVGDLLVQDGGKLAPGLSPGIINANNVTLAGTYEVEVAGTVPGEYDQTKVTGSVTINNAPLQFVRFNDYKPAANESYTIIDNDSTDAVTGAFANLAEGATFTAEGYVLRVSYVGGDGNDVVLTVQSVPSVPNTGFQIVRANPLLALLAGVMALGSAGFIYTRLARR